MRKIARTTLGVLVALGMLATVPAVVLAAGPACGDTLTANTTLTTNLDCSAYDGNALTLGANGITLNLNGHKITGYAGDDYDSGVLVEANNTVVTNGTIENFGYGVYLDHVVKTKVKWLTINGEAGGSDDYGIYVDRGAANKINHNTVDGTYDGIYLAYGASHVIKHNNVTADDTAFYPNYETLDTFAYNTAHAAYGFYDYDSGGNKYQYNTANGGSETGFYMECDDYGHVTLIGNTANNNGAGFYLTDCYIDPPGSARASLIKGNTANGNTGNGFEDYYSVGSTWTRNTANDNGDDGFYFDYPGELTITSNVAKRNANSGFEFDDNNGVGYGAPKVVRWNTANKNDYGFYANSGIPHTSNTSPNTATNNTTANCYNMVCP